jgi:hypothetical protein
MPIPSGFTLTGFRTVFQATSGEHDERLRQVSSMIDDGRPVAQVVRDAKKAIEVHRKRRPQIMPAIVKQFCDGKWHTAETIADALNIEDGAEWVAEVLGNAATRPGASSAYTVHKQVRRNGTSYRIFPKDKTVSVVQTKTELGPIIDHLQQLSERAPGTVPNASLAIVARQLRDLVRKWGE